MNLPILLLLGGYGTRLKVLTKQKPKSVIEINEKPFLYWQLKYFKEQGGRDSVLFIGYMGDQMRSFFWSYKKDSSNAMSNELINRAYYIAMVNGALGRKLIGADGGSFLMFYTEDKIRLRSKLKDLDLKKVRFQFDDEGTKVLT